jgi:hypothetical protein
MTWVTDPAKHEAINEHGYRLSWAHNKHGTWFNGWSCDGKHLACGYDDSGKAMCEAACEAHFSNVCNRGVNCGG